MKPLTRTLGRLVLVSVAVLLVACAGTASVDTDSGSLKPLTVTLADLQGSYSGPFKSRGVPDGVVYFSDEITLEIENDTATWASLQSGSGSSPITLGESGQTIMFLIGSDERTFTVSEDAGAMVLQARYRSRFGQWPRSNLITLTKKPSR